MKAIKRFNNNVVLCVDNNGHNLVAFGKGIGFHPLPYDIPLPEIERTYYDVDPSILAVLSDLPEEMIEVATKIAGYANTVLEETINSSIVFTLADHINFAYKRYKENINITLPIIYDVQHLFEKEMKVGMYALRIMHQHLKIHFPREEAAAIALHLANAVQNAGKETQNEEIIQGIVKIVENEYGIKINTDSYNYSRFVSHMNYLIKRTKNNNMFCSENSSLLKEVIEEYPETYRTAEKIYEYFTKKMNCQLTDEEKLYLMLYINRLCFREEGN